MAQTMGEQIKALKTIDKIKLVSKVLMMASKELADLGVKGTPDKLAKAATTFFDQVESIEKAIDIARVESIDEMDAFSEEFALAVQPNAPFPHLKQGEKIIKQWNKNKEFWERKAFQEGKGRKWTELEEENKAENDKLAFAQVQLKANSKPPVFEEIAAPIPEKPIVQSSELKTFAKGSFKGKW